MVEENKITSNLDTVEIVSSSNQVTITLPSEENFKGTYIRIDNTVGFHTQVEISFESSIINLYNNDLFSDMLDNKNIKFNLINYSDYKKLAISCFDENKIPIGIGDILLEANKSYKLFKENVENIPKVINVKFPGMIDYSITDSDIISINYV